MRSGRSKRLLLVVVGVAAVVPLVGVDPALAVLLLDVEFIALMGSVGVAMTRDNLRVAWARVCVSHPVVLVAAGVRMTRLEPRSLLSA